VVPDSGKNRRGFNPVLYPDLTFTYHVHVTALEGNRFRVTVDLEEPLPDEWTERVGFNLELFPGDLFGKAFLVDDQTGIFPDQPVGPMVQQPAITDEERESLRDITFGSPESSVLQQLTRPLATGGSLVIAPEDPMQRMIIESRAERLRALGWTLQP
jgi:endoglucanase